MERIYQFLKQINKSRGQGVVEYGLILILVIVATAAIMGTQESAERALTGSFEQTASHNPKANKIALPAPVTGEDVWDRTPDRGGEGLDLKPVAYFTISNPIYAGAKVTYWDNSYDPDGEIVTRTWTGKVDIFNTPGDYKIKLTVKDNDGLTDSYEVTVKVKERETYTELIYDHSKEVRTLVKESDVYNVGSKVTRILDHIYGESADLYGVKHVTIMKNYYEGVQSKAKDITYNVKIPVMEVTFNGRGQEISRKPYLVNGVAQFIYQTDARTVPQPAEIETEWRDNNWTYYVYNRVSSVRNPSGSWGERSAGVDYLRFDPETKTTTQSPTWSSSRTTTKSNSHNPGYDAASTPCKTCTKPNIITPKSENQSDYRTVSCSVGSSNELTHTRTYNYIDHKASDTLYKYTGTGLATGTYTEIERVRHTWKTEGWQAAEMRGTSGYAARTKYTNCDGNGSSESCWKPVTSSETFTMGWEPNGQDISTEKQTVRRQTTVNGKLVYVDVKQERTVTVTHQKRKIYTCQWLGTTKTSDTYVWDYTSSTHRGPWRDV